MIGKILKVAPFLMLVHLDGLAADPQEISRARAKQEESDAVIALIKVFPKTSIPSLNQLPPRELIKVHNNLVVCIDLDSTLLTYKNKFRHYPNEAVFRFMSEFLPKVRSCTQSQLTSFIQWLDNNPDSIECELLESDSVRWLKEVDNLARCSFALTARKRCIKEQTKNNLLRLGADFGKWSRLSRGDRVATGAGFHEVEISDGIIFTGNSVKKAQIMDALAQMITKEFGVAAPFTIVHIDDNLEEIDAHFENEIVSSSMIPWSVLPIHFTGIEEHLKSLAKDEVAYGKMFQDQILGFYDAFASQTIQ